VDAGVAALCVLVFWLPLEHHAEWQTSVHIGLIMILVAGLLTRSRWPLLAFGLVAASTFAGVVLGMTHDPFVAAAWTLYPVAVARGSTRSSSIASAALGIVIVATAFLGSVEFENALRYTLLSMLVLTGSWMLGNANRRERVEAEHALRAEYDRAVVAERLRVVREVHDVVSHSLGTIAVTAGVAAHVGWDNAGRVREKLAQIEETSKHALDELHVVLGAVRDRDESGERAPQPGIGELPNLVKQAENAGVSVRLTVTGAGDVPSGVGLAVYRIVQEGLTNTTRHAPRAQCSVTVTGARHEILVEIVDDGAGRARGGSSGAGYGGAGYGLVGLRERVELLGGEFTSGQLSTDGFAVRAVIPLRKS
jgi:signal transduction histidine kinase